MFREFGGLCIAIEGSFPFVGEGEDIRSRFRTELQSILKLSVSLIGVDWLVPCLSSKLISLTIAQARTVSESQARRSVRNSFLSNIIGQAHTT